MSEMIERVAAALIRAGEEIAIDDYEFTPSVAEMFARAAIEAMREPTAKMVEEAWASALAENAAHVWRDMIDAALS